MVNFVVQVGNMLKQIDTKDDLEVLACSWIVVQYLFLMIVCFQSDRYELFFNSGFGGISPMVERCPRAGRRGFPLSINSRFLLINKFWQVDFRPLLQSDEYWIRWSCWIVWIYNDFALLLVKITITILNYVIIVQDGRKWRGEGTGGDARKRREAFAEVRSHLSKILPSC